MAGLEERLSKIESTLHRLLCCDSNQFVGPEGPEGPEGPQGDPGEQGPPGEQGDIGPAGLIWQGPWDPCVIYFENDAVSYNGSSYYVTCPTSDLAPCYSYEVSGVGTLNWVNCEGENSSLTFDDTFSHIMCSMAQLPSKIGDLSLSPIIPPNCASTACIPPDINSCFDLLASQGEQGLQGDPGNQGEQGLKGDKGDEGKQGEQGNQGEKGEQGNQGEKGNTGDKGEKGEQGFQGDQGEKGDKGDPGEKGNPGDKGDTGQTGQTGQTGDKGDKGDQGDPGIDGTDGNDGSNSGRWKWDSVFSSPADPGSNYFTTDSLNFNTLTQICVSFEDTNSTDYTDWWTALYDFGVDFPNSTFLIQITEVGSNNIIGIYQVSSTNLPVDIVLFPTYVEIELSPMYVSNSVFSTNLNYTISWSIQATAGNNESKQKGVYEAVSIPGPYPVIAHTFNEGYSDGGKSYILLPNPSYTNQQVYMVAKGDEGFYIRTFDGANKLLLYGKDLLNDELRLLPRDVYRFTWDGSEYWIVEYIEGLGLAFNERRPVEDKFQIQETVHDAVTLSFPSLTTLNTNYPSNIIGFKVYMTALSPPYCFVKVGTTSWESFPTTTVT